MSANQEEKVATGQEEKAATGLLIELIDLVKRYLSQEIKSAVESLIVGPVKKVGFWSALTLVAATFFSLAILFLAVGAFQLLATLVGATWIAYLIIGALLFVGGVIVLLMRPRGGDTDGKK